MPPTDKPAGTTHFGYRDVPVGEKAGLVRGVFDSVASRYDLMNDLMSAGMHRLWKRYTILDAAARPGQAVLDLGGGTGDLAGAFARAVGREGLVVLADINAAMLREGRRRLVDAGVAGNLSIAQVDAERLPFADDSFDRISIAFGLRNVTDKDRALREMRRVAKPGGKVLILEFSKPHDVIRPAYDLYSFGVLPVIGRLVARDADSYRYLAESIRKHPDQDELREMMRSAGFAQCRYHNLSGGIVALHTGYKL